MTENELTYKIRGAIFKVYRSLGPGLLENIYEEALCYQLRKEGLVAECQVDLPVFYDGALLKSKLRLDILVENKVIIELKSVKKLEEVHHKQLLSYLRLTDKHLGILVNFNTDDINKSMFRKVNGYKTENE